MLLQYLVSPAIVGWTMKVKWVTEAEEPELHRMVAELAQEHICRNRGWVFPRLMCRTPLHTDGHRKTDGFA